MALHKIYLVNAVVKETNLNKKESSAAVDAVMATIKTSLENGEEIEIPATKTPAFKVGKLLREAVNKQS